MQNHIQDDCYWFIEGEGDEGVMKALCPFCAGKLNKGWFWNGKECGYGNYDLFCANCNNAINTRGDQN